MTSGRQAAESVAIRAAEIQLRTFPSVDHAFRSFVRAALLRNVTLAPDELQSAIRARYPVAVVRAQDAFARRADTVVWYAFRYGSIVDPSVAPPHDWNLPGVAEAIIDADRRFLEVNDALAAIVELPPEVIVGHVLEEFTNPGDPSIREDLAVLWSEFLASGTAEFDDQIQPARWQPSRARLPHRRRRSGPRPSPSPGAGARQRSVTRVLP